MTLRSRELESFLSFYAADPEIVPAVMESIAPLFRLAANRRYPSTVPIPESSIDGTEETLCSAISEAVGAPVRRIIGLSLTRSPRGIYRTRSRLTLLECLRKRYYDDLLRRAGRETCSRIWRLQWRALGQDLVTSLPAHLRYTLWNSIGPTVYYFLGYALLDDHQALSAFDGLVSVLPWAVPLRANAALPDIWFAAVA